MKKSKLYITLGTLVLASTAFMASKPAEPRKQGLLGALLKLLGAGGINININITINHFTTVQGTHRTACLVTSFGGFKIATLLTSSSGLRKVYYK